jgi:proton-coupled amino acid transporter
MTVLQTYLHLHLVKGYIGTGCLSLPWACLFTGISTCILLCLWSSYNCQVVEQLKRQSSVHTYPEVGEWAYGKKFKSFVTCCVCIQQLAICTVFLSFCGQNTLAALPREIHHVLVTTLALPAVLALSCIPTLKRVSWATLAGTLTLLLALILLFVAMAQHDRTDTKLPTLSWRKCHLPLAPFCIPSRAFVSCCKWREPWTPLNTLERYFGPPRRLCALCFAPWQGVPWLCTGTWKIAYILNRFTDNRDMILIANTFVSVSVLLTYPLQMFPCLELGGAWAEHYRNGGLEQLTMDELDEAEKDSALPGDSPHLRLGLVVLTYVMAIVVPNVRLLISLAGALCGSSIALIIPQLLELESVRLRSSNNQQFTEQGKVLSVVSPWNLIMLDWFGCVCYGYNTILHQGPNFGSVNMRSPDAKLDAPLPILLWYECSSTSARTFFATTSVNFNNYSYVASTPKSWVYFVNVEFGSPALLPGLPS